MRSRFLLGILIVVMVVLSGCRVVARVNIPTGDAFPPSPSDAPASSSSLSSDGSVAAFSSSSAALVANDVNNVDDVFVRTGTTTYRVSVSPFGAGGNGASTDPQVSADASTVVFVSAANNLVPGDNNGVADVFVADLLTATVSRVSVGASAAEANAASGEPAVSADGRFVIFTSEASNLVAGDSNAASDVFVHDRLTGTTTRVSANGGVQANAGSRAGAISPSGDWVAFESDASNLVSGDSNNSTDVFAVPRAGGTVLRMSTPDALSRPFQQSNGDSTAPVITDELNNFIGSGEPLVVFTSTATNLAGNDNNGAATDVFATTRLFGSFASTTRLTSSALASHSPSVAVVDGGPGHVMAFVTGSDVVTALRSSPVDSAGIDAETVSVTATGVPANGVSADPALSADGRFVTFSTTAGNLNNPSLAPTVGDVVVARARDVVIESIDDPFIGVGETRQFTVTGSGFDTGAAVLFSEGMSASSVTVVSSTELVVVATAATAQPGVGFRDMIVTVPGVDGTSVAMATAVCADCIEIASVVDQGGPVDIEITSGSIEIANFTLPLPSCPFGFCPALPATVGFDGALEFGAESLEIDGIELPVELIPGVETTVELVPVFNAPAGLVVPANGSVNLAFGFAIEVRALLLPSGCSIGPVGASLSTANAGGVPYNQSTGQAVLAGMFTEELAITGCGLFTGVLNSALNLPAPIAQNALVFGVQFNPVLTGTIIP